jgi:multidrug efflux pump subunit AcrB
VERLIRFFVDRHQLVHVLVVGVIALGLLQAARLPRETFPNVTIPMVFITGTLPGAAARDVETKIAIPIQDAVQELDGAKSFSTVVSDSLSRTEVELYDDFSPERIREAARDMRVLIDGITDFPPEMEDEPRVQHLNSKLFPVIQIALAGPSEAVIRAGRVLEHRLRGLDQVSRISVVGLDEPEVRIYVDPGRARENSVTLLDVTRAVERRNVSATGGLLESARDRRQVVLWSRYLEPEEVGDTVVRFSAGGGAVRIRDVARIEAGREDNGLIAHTDGEPGISLVINKQEDADIVETVDAVRTLVARTPLPLGVKASFVRDESFMTRNRLRLMLHNGVVGAVLVTAVLFVFLTPVAAFWTLAGIPVVFLATLALFPVFGLPINIITLTGLVVVLGMIVDDAIVVSERIVARRQFGEERHEAAVRGAAEMARPVLASALTTMLAFLPMWAIGGMSGRLMWAMPAVVMLALGLSVVESFIMLPAHLSMGTRRGDTPKRPFMIRWEAAYRTLLERSLRHRGVLVAAFGAALLIVFGAIAPSMPVVLFAQDDSQSLFVKVTMPPGTPIERTEAVVAALERQLPGLMEDDLISQIARIGHQDPEAFDRTQGSAANEAFLIAQIRPTGRRHTSAEWIEILEDRLVVPAAAHLVFEAEYLGPPVGKPVTIHVASNDDERRRGGAIEIASWLRAIEGLTSVEIDERPGTPQIELALDYDRLALRGLDPESVARTVQVAFHGAKASEHRDLDDTTAFRVMLEPSARRDLDALLEIPVRSDTGELVQLRDVVTPVEVPAVTRIFHRNGRRTATVTAGIALDSHHTALSMAKRIETELLPRYADASGLELTLGGEAEETRKTTGDIGLAALLAVGGIAVVIALMLGSFLEAAFVVAVVPFAIAGVILAFFLHGMPLSMFAMMGSIGLAGVVVNASIVMIDAVHRSVARVAAYDLETRREALLDAVVSRLRPIVVTTLTTLGGVLPMAYGIGGEDAVVAPMSLALGWGLAFSTAVTLFLVPALYTLAGDVRALRLTQLQLPDWPDFQPVKSLGGRILRSSSMQAAKLGRAWRRSM